MIAFGPVPSRRLGYSLGINHIPAKHCSYSCVYCQVGRTNKMEIERKEFYPIDQVICDVEKKVLECSQVGKVIDYLTLVPDGEPTLDINLGNIIKSLKQFQIPIAVISNASLINRLDVQEELLQADWVSLKVDAIDEQIWRMIDRPHRALSLANILNGILEFRQKFCGKLVSETMLADGLNDNEKAASQLCEFLLNLHPFLSYLSIPTRPPAETRITAPSPDALQKFLKICAEQIPFLDLLFETEVGDFVSTGNFAEDVLSITAVHPLREQALKEMVINTGNKWEIVEDLLASGKISCVSYRNDKFFLHNFKNNQKEQ